MLLAICFAVIFFLLGVLLIEGIQAVKRLELPVWRMRMLVASKDLLRLAEAMDGALGGDEGVDLWVADLRRIAIYLEQTEGEGVTCDVVG